MSENKIKLSGVEGPRLPAAMRAGIIENIFFKSCEVLTKLKAKTLSLGREYFFAFVTLLLSGALPVTLRASRRGITICFVCIFGFVVASRRTEHICSFMDCRLATW